VDDVQDFDADPELIDEDDPDFRTQMFELFQSLGWKPEDLTDRQYAAKYADWLTAVSEEK
jgi:hypothetical protein